MHSQNQEKMDRWFEQHNGDPWDYKGSKSIQTRLKKLLSLVNKYFPTNFNGCFIEFGCFDGSFTKMLSAMFPYTQIQASDVSNTAIKKARHNIEGRENVHLFWCDLENIENTQDMFDKNSAAVFLFECIYYLDREKRIELLNTCKNMFPNALFFCSVPITGGPYFTEDEFIKIVENGGGRIMDIKTVSFKIGGRYLLALCHFLSDRSKLFRFVLANQVCFVFK